MNSGHPFFSIVIPTYQRPEQLVACCEALSRLAYPRPRFEVIVVDDGGTHPLVSWLEPFQRDLKLTVLWQPNAGPAEARNLGSGHAKGEYLAFLDDDCRPAPQWLSAAAVHLASSPDHLIGGRTINALPHNPYSCASQAIIEVAYAHYNAHPAGAAFFASNNLIVPTRHFRAIGGFDPSFRTSEDRDFCARWLWEGYKMAYVPEVVMYHAHVLTVASFWRQHFGYGRGARRHHTACARRGAGKFRPDRTFYRKLFTYPFQQGDEAQAPRLLSLLLLAQVANAAGFFWEWTCYAWKAGKSLPPQNKNVQRFDGARPLR